MASTVYLFTRSLYSDTPPNLQTKADMNPTLLVSWWATGFSIVTILIRVMGRFVRTEKLFLEDKIMFYAIIPLLIRMGFVHVVLIWGTNNTVTTGLDAVEIHHREIGSKLVLSARVFYAMYIWIAKYSLIAFLKRIIGTSWHKSYEIAMRWIDGFLALTFIAVFISTLAECHPFNHYWQVVPDPGPHCREAIAQLITMGVCDIVTDLVLILFPIPLVVMSAMPLKRKISLILLFLLSFILIAVTAYRVPTTINRHAAQQYRSLLASLEILAATAVSNAVVIGSFIRDRGVKKAKFRASSISEPDGTMQPISRTKSIAQNHWGSDEDLVREFGMSLDPALRHRTNVDEGPRVAPVALPNSNAPAADLLDDVDPHLHSVSSNWNFNKATRRRRQRQRSASSASSISTLSDEDIKLHDLEASAGTTKRKLKKVQLQPKANDEVITSPKMSFFDVGGLMDDNISPTNTRNGAAPQSVSPEIQHQPRRSSRAFLADIGGLLAPSSAIRTGRSPHRRQSDQDASNSSRDLVMTTEERGSGILHPPAPAPLPVPGDVGRRISGRRGSGPEGSPFPRSRGAAAVVDDRDSDDDDEEEDEDSDELEEERFRRTMARRRRRRDPRRLLGEEVEVGDNTGVSAAMGRGVQVEGPAGQATAEGRGGGPVRRERSAGGISKNGGKGGEGRGKGGFDSISFGDAGGLLG